VIVSAVEHYKQIHPDALATRNGVKVIKPAWKIADEEK